jgi:two-component system, cell cycle sensor histidine kinase and response regulator CckA
MNEPTDSYPADAGMEQAIRRREEERRRDAALARFAGHMAHDVSNFVTVMRTYSELLLADTPGESPARDDLLEIKRAADALVRYLHRVTRFARVRTVRLGPVVLDDVVRSLLTGDAPSGQAWRIDAALQCGAQVNSDQEWLHDALNELLENAADAAPEGTRIRLVTRFVQVVSPILCGDVPIPPGAWAVVEVRDSGPGFRPVEDGAAGEPFVSSKVGVRGAGVDLAFVRALAWRSDGELVMRRDGDETSVELWLPALPPT